MFHLCAFSESQDTSGVLTNVAALADPSMTVSGDNIQVPDYAGMLAAVWAGGTTITRAQLQSPSLRRILNYEIIPLDKSPTPTSPQRFAHFEGDPIQLDVSEQLQALVAEGAAGAEQETVLVWLSDAPIVPIAGPFYTVRVTAAVTLVANAWTNASLTFDQVLPVGRYAIAGADFMSTGLIAYRFLFQGSTPRPGGLANLVINGYAHEPFRAGKWGEFGEFESTTPPTVDFLSSSADTSEVGYLDLIKVG